MNVEIAINAVVPSVNVLQYRWLEALFIANSNRVKVHTSGDCGKVGVSRTKRVWGGLGPVRAN